MSLPAIVLSKLTCTNLRPAVPRSASAPATSFAPSLDTRPQVEALYSFQEKVDALQKLQMELELARHAAAAASPAVFGLGMGAGGATPQLGIGQMQGGLAGLAQRGGADLASTQAKLAHWLAAQNPEMAHMSNERREMVERYAQIEHYLVRGCRLFEEALLARAECTVGLRSAP